MVHNKNLFSHANGRNYLYNLIETSPREPLHIIGFECFQGLIIKSNFNVH